MKTLLTLHLQSQLTTLDPYTIDIREPYTPIFDNGKIAKGITFGVKLRSYPYSQHLLDLISECLYEHPAHRPAFPQLKERVRDGFNAAVLVNGGPEPWADFLPPPPPVELIQCQAILGNGNRCGKQFKPQVAKKHCHMHTRGKKAKSRGRR
jgi:hypothetical protein